MGLQTRFLSAGCVWTVCTTPCLNAPCPVIQSPAGEGPPYLHCLMKVILVLFKQPEGHQFYIFQQYLAASLQIKSHQGNLLRENG